MNTLSERLARFAVMLLFVLALAAIASSALDLHCTSLRPTSTSIIIACSASRLASH